MRLYDIEIDGTTYKACCGLRALEEIQSEYGALDEFERRLMEAQGGADEINKKMDVATIIYATKLFLSEGARAEGCSVDAKELERIVEYATNIYSIWGQVCAIYLKSMHGNVEDEKNGESQTENQ